jgi:hypothetical protein
MTSQSATTPPAVDGRPRAASARRELGVDRAQGGRRRPFEVDVRRVIAALIPHVRRALQVHQHLVAAQHEHAVATEALEALACAVFFVDADSQVILTNEKGARPAGGSGWALDRARATVCGSARTDAEAALHLRRHATHPRCPAAIQGRRTQHRAAVRTARAAGHCCPTADHRAVGDGGVHVAALAGVMSLLITIKSGPGPLR